MAWDKYSSKPCSASQSQLRRKSSVAGAAVVVSVAMVAAPGCRTSQQASIPNPFLTADRVPAPPSRIPAMGTAQPYYPGDAMPPLPGSPTVPQPVAQPLGALPPADDITPIPADGTLAAAPPTTVPLAPLDSAAGNEPVVQIPSDEGSLRFAAVPQQTPLPAPAPPTSVTPQQQPVPTPTAFREPQTPPPTAPVVSNWPPAAVPTPQVTLSPVSNEGAASGLFRNPNVGAEAPPLFHQISPTHGQTTAPRIRVPGSAERIREDVVPGSINTTSYQVGMAGGGPAQTRLVPPPGHLPASLSTDPAAAPPPRDGFRPRGSARSSFGASHAAPSIPTLHVTPG